MQERERETNEVIMKQLYALYHDIMPLIGSYGD